MTKEASRDRTGSASPRSTLDRPLPGRVDDVARAAVERTHSQVWAPALVAVVGLAGMALILIVIGEAITHLGLFSELRGADDRVSANLAAHRTSGWNSFSTFWSHSAETAPIVVGGLLVEIVLALRKRWRDMLLMVIGLGLELATFLLVNEVVRRARPSVEKLGIVPTTFSFPSGHTAATIVLYGSIVLLVTLHMRSRLVKVLPWLLVLLITVAVGYARVYRGMHHVSDVVTGAIMGVGALLVAVTATRASSIASQLSNDHPDLDIEDDHDCSAPRAPISPTGEVLA
jgi:membrane-associated phospholipid phosphatase